MLIKYFHIQLQFTIIILEFRSEICRIRDLRSIVTSLCNNCKFSYQLLLIKRFTFDNCTSFSGTMFFWGRYLNYPRKSEFYILPHYRDYIVHYHDSSWHHWDGKVVWYFFNHAFLFWTLLAIIFICIGGIYIYFLKVESTINVVKSLRHV